MSTDSGDGCIPDCPDNHYIEQAGFELMDIQLPLPPEC